MEHWQKFALDSATCDQVGYHLNFYPLSAFPNHSINGPLQLTPKWHAQYVAPDTKFAMPYDISSFDKFHPSQPVCNPTTTLFFSITIFSCSTVTMATVAISLLCSTATP